MKKFTSLASLVVIAAFPFASLQACGPDFSPDVFVHHLRPDIPRDFAAGRLGVLLPTYPRLDLAVAYRYLNGGTLTPAEQKGYQPTYSMSEEVERDTAANASQAEAAANGNQYMEPPGPADAWLKARNRYAPAPAEIHDIRQYGMLYSAGSVLAGSYDNCQADAFRTAAATLESRAKTWGAHSPQLADWIKGQDAVFSNCGSGGSPGSNPSNKPTILASPLPPIPLDAPLLLRQDRAYQIAAAQFYTHQLSAVASFQAIAQDSSSPWCGVARYMVARTLVRYAFLGAPPASGDNMAGFDPALMKQAQQQLESMRNQQLPGVSRHAVESLLHLVQLRTQPNLRLAELSAALAGPKTDPDYPQDLVDLTWYLNAKLDSLPIRADTDDFAFHINTAQNDYRPLTSAQRQTGFDQTFHDVADLRSISPLIDWLITVQSPAESAKKHALAEWERTKRAAWLTAAIMKASSSDAAAPVLLEAAAHVPAGSPAWPTIEYHRLRLLIESGHAAEARNQLAAVLPQVQATASESAVNLFTGLRMRAASSLDDALANAPRRILDRTSEEQSSLDECLDVMKDPKRKYDCRQDTSPVEFSSDAATLFNQQTPLTTLAAAAQSSALPPQLRQSVAIMTWVRAVLLKNQPVAARMLPRLPAKLQQQAGSGVGFRPLMAILRNPGLRPYLDGGVQRSESYDFVESYGDNWWCAGWTNLYEDNGAPVQAGAVAFLSPQELDRGTQESKTLLAMGGSDLYLGAQVLAWAKAHPSDPHVPEALYLTLRMIRYGCNRNWEDSGKPQADSPASIAFQIAAIMRRQYPTNPWTKKAAPFAGLGQKSG